MEWVHIGARALHVINLIWFGCIARLSQCGGGGNYLVQMISTCLPSGRGMGDEGRHHVGETYLSEAYGTYVRTHRGISFGGEGGRGKEELLKWCWKSLFVIISWCLDSLFLRQQIMHNFSVVSSSFHKMTVLRLKGPKKWHLVVLDKFVTNTSFFRPHLNSVWLFWLNWYI